jgi:hypothetical protein
LFRQVIGASPLIVDSDIRNLSSFQRGTLLHEEMLALHHDPGGVGGSRIGVGVCNGTGTSHGTKQGPEHTTQHITQQGPEHTKQHITQQGPEQGAQCSTQVWAKPLHGNATAVGLYNAANVSSKPGFSFRLLGFTSQSQSVLTIRDVWGRRNLGHFKASGEFHSDTALPPHGTLVLQVAAK